MITFDDIKDLSLLPITNTRNPERIIEGSICEIPIVCKNKFSNTDICKKFYKSNSDISNSFLECPFGFSSYFHNYNSIKYALTCIIPFPRQGSNKEMEQSKKYPNNKYSREDIITYDNKFVNIVSTVDKKEKDIFENYSKALHEIRKFNRTIKQISEVLVKNDSDNEQLLRIYKASELMSKQHDIIEILANDSLLKLEVNNNCEVYKLFDKIRKIIDSKGIIKLKAQLNFSPIIKVCDRTFPIIANVLISNAIKYCVGGSEIEIEINRYGENKDKCIIKVINEISMNLEINEDIFIKGFRGNTTREGSGYGLYVAQLVAKQHKTEITLNVEKNKNKKYCSFKFVMDIT